MQPFLLLFLLQLQIVKEREKEQPKPVGIFLLCVFLEETIGLSSLVAKLVKSLQRSPGEGNDNPLQ